MFKVVILESGSSSGLRHISLWMNQTLSSSSIYPFVPSHSALSGSGTLAVLLLLCRPSEQVSRTHMFYLSQEYITQIHVQYDTLRWFTTTSVSCSIINLVNRTSTYLKSRHEDATEEYQNWTHSTKTQTLTSRINHLQYMYRAHGAHIHAHVQEKQTYTSPGTAS